MSSGGRTDGANNPDICNFWSQRQSQRSGFGRPGTFLPWRALTRATAKPRAARICHSGIQDTPVDSSTTVGIRQGVHQAASRCKSQGNARKCLDRWGSAIRGHTAPVCLSPHINAGGMRVDAGHILEGGRVLLAFFRHTFLQAGGEREEQGKPGLLLRKATRGGGERRDCFIWIEPARSVGGTLTTRIMRLTARGEGLPPHDARGDRGDDTIGQTGFPKPWFATRLLRPRFC